MPGPVAAGSGGKLNAAQRRRVRSSFARVDEILGAVQRTLDASPESSPFGREIPDATPLQRKVVADYAARARVLMASGLQRLGIEPSQADVSAVWAARVSLRSAQIAVAESGSTDLRGYGSLGEEAARELDGVIAPLLSLLEQMEALLAQGAGAQLEARLQRLDAVQQDLRLLAQAGRIVAERGWVEFRATLETLAERAEGPQMEIALFGRSNAGKSSLLNFVLAQSVLPVGPTPVTAVPVRVVHGLRRQGRVSLADAAPQILSLDRIAEFANETQNPANVRHVTRLEIQLPMPLLERGVCLVDSPGYGALASAPDDVALAYVPRCDVGILAIDAASPPNSDDAAVLDRLLRAGAAAMVVLTKADALADRDALLALVHARRQLASATGSEVPVHLVSVKENASDYGRRWLQSALAPLIEDGLALRRRSVRRKIVALAREIAAALERRLSSRSEPTPSGGWLHAEAALGDAARALERARAWQPGPLAAASAAQACVAQAAYNAALLLQRDPQLPNDLTPVVVASARSRQGVAADAAARDLRKLRALLQNALAEAGAAARRPESADCVLPRLSGLPPADADMQLAPLVVARKPIATGIRFLLERSLRRRMRRTGIAAQLAAELGRYGRQLQDWRNGQIDLLKQAFTACADRLRSRQRADPALRAHAERLRLEQDLQRLRTLLDEPSEEQAAT